MIVIIRMENRIFIYERQSDRERERRAFGLMNEANRRSSYAGIIVGGPYIVRMNAKMNLHNTSADNVRLNIVN